MSVAVKHTEERNFGSGYRTAHIDILRKQIYRRTVVKRKHLLELGFGRNILDRNVFLVDFSSLSVYKDGYTISGEFKSPTGYIYSLSLR